MATLPLQNGLRVLAVRATTRGFGYAVLEGPGLLVDWGLKEGRQFNLRRSAAQFAGLLAFAQPELLLVSQRDEQAPRSRRKRALLAELGRQAAARGVARRAVPQALVHRLFTRLGLPNKYGRAGEIARRFPELDCALPRPRVAWRGEDTRLSLFEAVALALTYYYSPDCQESA